MISSKLILNALVASIAAATLASDEMVAQAASPVVIVHGRGEIDVAPDRGEILVSVETRAKESAAAGDANAVIVRAVLDSLRRGFKLGEADLMTAGYSLQPQMLYSQDGKPPQLVGYIVTNSVRVRTDQMTKIGAMIDAALKKGATGVGGVSFYVANADSVRRRAGVVAVGNARRDAEALAAASGMRLGALIELTADPIEPYQGPRPVMLMAARSAESDSPVLPGEQKVVVTVTAKWGLVPAR